MDDQNNEMFDLGSEPVVEDFDPFAADEESNTDTIDTNGIVEVIENASAQLKEEASANTPKTKESDSECVLQDKSVVNLKIIL